MDLNESILEALAITAEICGSVMSEAAVRAVTLDLMRFPEPAVLGALVRCRREITGRLTLAAIIERIDDGRPSADEAWAVVGTVDEGVTFVTTEEAMEARGVCADLLTRDPQGARMAFHKAYEATVARARTAGTPVRWVASLGHDRGGREGPIREAVARGRLDAGQGEMLVGPRRALPASPMLALPAGEPADPTAIRDLLRGYLKSQGIDPEEE